MAETNGQMECTAIDVSTDAPAWFVDHLQKMETHIIQAVSVDIRSLAQKMTGLSDELTKLQGLPKKVNALTDRVVKLESTLSNQNTIISEQAKRLNHLEINARLNNLIIDGIGEEVTNETLNEDVINIIESHCKLTNISNIQCFRLGKK